MNSLEARRELRWIGQEIMDDVLDGDFTGRHGLVVELFPYIYEMSKKISARAISRQLTARGIKISAQTIAKALREEKMTWTKFFEDFEPAARVVGEVWKRSMEDVLWMESDVFKSLVEQVPVFSAVTEGEFVERRATYDGAVADLEAWFDVEIETRGRCLDVLGLRTRSGKKGKRGKRA